MEEHEIKIKTLTPLWTGDINQECSRVKETGIIGSLRWWYEALVRGLGGYACDPTEDDSCSLDYKKFKKDKKETSLQEALDQQICPVCQMFGSAGWKKRFRLEIEVSEDDISKGIGPEDGLKSDSEFKLKIIELSKISNYHKWLFKKTLEIIEQYGAIGGRTTWKPGDDWGTNYGLISVTDYNKIKRWDSNKNKEIIEKWLRDNKKNLEKENKGEWFNFRYFWIDENSSLDREQLNDIVNRKKDDPEKYNDEVNEFDEWLGGEEGKSKKIFSFKSDDIKRIFGYVKNGKQIEKIENKLEKKIEDLSLLTGKNIIGDFE